MPKYDYNNPFGALHKCELCNQKGVERLDKGGLPGCVEAVSYTHLDVYKRQALHMAVPIIASECPTRYLVAA